MEHVARIKMDRFTFKNFATMFPDDAACLEWLSNHPYPKGIFCKICDRVTKHHRVISRPSYSCGNCGHHVHPTAGTIFHQSSTSLKTWFHAIYLMASTRCGISAKQIEREMGVTYKTAWRMFHQIRKLLVEDETPLSGSVEMDEMYHGGKRKHGTGRPAVRDKKKVPVVGMVQRGGRAIVRATADIQSATLLTMVREYVLPATTVFADELRNYSGSSVLRDKQGRKAGYQHHRINHSSKIYVQGDIHTNSVEGF